MGRDSIAVCCLLFCLKCLFFGWLLFPFHVFKCIFMKNPDRDVTLDNRPCHGRVDSETCCLPLKKNCSANGKNKIYGCKIPFGILEVLCMITGVFAALLGFQAKNFPFAYIDTAPLVAGPRILMNSDSYFMFTGDY